jgi:hypothetical protein
MQALDCEEGAIQTLCLFCKNTNSYLDSSLTKTFESAPCYTRKGVRDSDDDTWNTLLEDEIGTRWSLAVVRAGLEGHVDSRFREELALLYGVHSHHLGVGLTTTVMISLTDDASRVHYDCSNHWIGRGMPQSQGC